METIQETKYKCSTCGKKYELKSDALSCETKPVTGDKGVKVGDTIMITTGQGQGRAKVTKVYVIDKHWGHHAWERYWHTVAVTADCEGGGSRMLTLDDYKII